VPYGVSSGLPMIEFPYILVAIAKGLALWLVPLAVVAYVVAYFVMAIFAVIVWKNGRDPTISSFWRMIGAARARQSRARK
jgi:hypothetical protein